MTYTATKRRNLSILFALSSLTLFVLARAFGETSKGSFSTMELLLIGQSVLLLCAAVGIWRNSYIAGYLLGETIAIGYVAFTLSQIVSNNFSHSFGPLMLAAFWMSAAYALALAYRAPKVALAVSDLQVNGRTASREAVNF